MRLTAALLFLTLVLGTPVTRGAPHESGILSESPFAEEARPTSDADVLDRAGLVIGQPPPTPPRPREVTYYYPYRQSLSPRLGLILDTRNVREQGLDYVLGFNYLSPRRRQPQWEFGADLVSNSDGHVSAAKRWIFYDTNTFRPFLKAGLTHRLVAEQKLASLGKLENYLFKGAIGFEDVIKTPMSVRFDLELMVGTEDVFLLIVFGYSWGW